MELITLILIIVGGFIFYLIEIFLIPGFGGAGIAAAICLLYAIYYAFASVSTTAGVLTLLTVVAGGVYVTRAFMKSKTLERLSLKKTLDDGEYRRREASGMPAAGDKGVALTRLALVGEAEFDGRQVEVKSADGFLDEKTHIVVYKVEDGVILVKKDI